MASSSVPNLPLFLVHASDDGKKVPLDSTRTGLTAPPRRRKERTKQANAGVSRSSSSPSTPKSGPLEAQSTSKKLRYNKHGKPSRRWLVLERDALQEENLELKNQLRIKEEIERDLVESRSQMEQEMSRLRSVGEKPDEINVESLKQRNRDLAQDVFLMKNIVIRLNEELVKYQEKYRKLRQSQGGARKEAEESGAEMPNSNEPRSPWILEGEITALAPLLESYDENLREKTSLILDYRREFDVFLGRLKEVALENEGLRKRLEETDKKGEITYTDWLALQRESTVTKEQNDLLLRQSKLQTNKFQELRLAFQSKLDECCGQRDEALEKSQQCRTELFLLKGKFVALQEELQRSQELLENKVPQSVHMASINECKRLFEELKARYDGEREELMRKIAANENRRPDLESQISVLSTERIQLQTRLKESEAQNSRLLEKTEEMAKKLEKAEQTKEDFRRQLVGSVSFSGELVAEQEKLLRQLREKSEEARIGGHLAQRLDHLKTQIQGVEKEAVEQMSALDFDLRRKTVSLEKLRTSQLQEMSHLKDLLSERELRIARLESEKSKTQEDLETVWKVATSEEKAKPANS